MVLDNELGNSRKNLQVEFKTIKGEKLTQSPTASPSWCEKEHHGDVPGELFLREPSGVCRFDSAEALPGEDSSRWEYGAATPENASCVVVALCLDCFLGGRVGSRRGQGRGSSSPAPRP